MKEAHIYICIQNKLSKSSNNNKSFALCMNQAHIYFKFFINQSFYFGVVLKYHETMIICYNIKFNAILLKKRTKAIYFIQKPKDGNYYESFINSNLSSLLKKKKIQFVQQFVQLGLYNLIYLNGLSSGCMFIFLKILSLKQLCSPFKPYSDQQILSF